MNGEVMKVGSAVFSDRAVGTLGDVGNELDDVAAAAAVRIMLDNTNEKNR